MKKLVALMLVGAMTAAMVTRLWKQRRYIRIN